MQLFTWAVELLPLAMNTTTLFSAILFERFDSAAAGGLGWNTVFCNIIHLWHSAVQSHYLRECRTFKSMSGHTLSLSIKAAVRHLPFCWIWMKWRLCSSQRQNSDIKTCMFESALHLVCEPTNLMRVCLWELWHCNKQPVWCVCLIIPPIQLSGGSACKHRQRTVKSQQMEIIHPSPNLFLHLFKAKKTGIHWIGSGCDE